jgi:hypothetical protein
VPGGSRQPRNDNAQALASFHGRLKVIDSKSLTLEMDDYRQLQFKLTGKTKFYKSGAVVKSADDFKPGDQLSVEAPDDPGNLTAVNVYWEKAASDAAKSGDNQDGVVDSWKDKPGEGGTERVGPSSRASDDPGPPTLKRGRSATPSAAAAPPPDDSPAPAAPAPRETVRQKDQPAAAPAPSPKQTAVNLPPNTVPLPPNTVSLPPPTSNAPSTAAPAPAPSSPSRPNLVGLPESTVSAPRPPEEGLQPREIVDDQTPLGQRPEEPLIRKAADAALDFTETLPNYVCQEVVSRYESTTRPVSWHAVDVVSTEVVFEDGKENYRNLTINGKPVNKTMEEMSGAWSTGEFGTLLIDLFSPATAADFHFVRDGRTGGIDAKIYDFQVRRENSHWNIHFGSQSYTPAYRGSTWIDPKTSRVLRIEIEASNLPPGFPGDQVESATDYQYVRLGGAQQYLLPVHAEILSCQRGTNFCSKNSIDFRNYRKYSGESTIQFGDVK